MRKKLNIIIIILAYGLNFAHDFQIHEHHEQDFFRISHHQVTEHFHDSLAECDHSESESNGLPFQHCHIEHAHDNVLLRNTQSSIHISDFAESSEKFYCFQPNVFDLKEIFSINSKNTYQAFTGLSLCLRSPPSVS
jgi:hypothetical protein